MTDFKNLGSSSEGLMVYLTLRLLMLTSTLEQISHLIPCRNICESRLLKKVCDIKDIDHNAGEQVVAEFLPGAPIVDRNMHRPLVALTKRGVRTVFSCQGNHSLDSDAASVGVGYLAIDGEDSFPRALADTLRAHFLYEQSPPDQWQPRGLKIFHAIRVDRETDDDSEAVRNNTLFVELLHEWAEAQFEI